MKLSPDEEDGMCELLGLTGQKFQMEFGPKKRKEKRKFWKQSYIKKYSVK
jgi:hypothetical protein